MIFLNVFLITAGIEVQDGLLSRDCDDDSEYLRIALLVRWNWDLEYIHAFFELVRKPDWRLRVSG